MSLRALASHDAVGVLGDSDPGPCPLYRCIPYALGMIRRNIVYYFFAQVAFASGTVLVVTLGGIVGDALAPSAALATLPLSSMVVGTAAATVPTALLMQRMGRRKVFSLGACTAVGSALLGALALQLGDFALFTVACFAIGATLAFSAQLRFAAAECVAEEHAGSAVSIILLGSIGGALIGPELAMRSALWTPEQPYQGAWLGLAGIYAIAGVLLACTKDPAPAAPTAGGDGGRALPAIIRQPAFIVAVLAGVVGQGAMVFIMTATPISMHVLDGHGLQETARVIQAHVVAMYLPSLASAFLIGYFGPRKMMAMGVVAMVATVAIGLAGRQVLHYWWALVILGVGWNFLFIGGTTALVATYQPMERFRAQGVNDFSVFGMSALASLSAGALLHAYGWSVVLLSTLPALALMLLAVSVRQFRRN